jgi:hypothetical protein
MANWFLQQGEQRLGPMPVEALRDMAANGQVAATDLVWTDGMASWQPASSQPWFQTGVAPYQPPYAPPPVFGQPAQPYVQPGSILGGQQPYIAEPPSLTGWSIAVLLCCCLPGGIIGLVQSNKVKSQWAAGNYAEAQATYNTAKNWLIGSAIAGVIINIIYGLSQMHKF